jgi:hypothetical protein
MLLLYLIFPAILIGLSTAIWGFIIVNEGQVFLTYNKKLSGYSARIVGYFVIIIGISLAVFAWIMASLFPEGLGH